MSTLFGHLALQFGTSAENLATESLQYILQSSPVACNAFLELLRDLGVDLPQETSFRTQVGFGDHGVPDLIGETSSGSALVIESKFWAGLTQHQPVGYLRDLTDEGGHLLLFIAPGARFPTLWGELLRRCRNAEIDVVSQTEGNGSKTAQLDLDIKLAMVSWRYVLEVLLRRLREENETRSIADLRQLQGLCERMDSEAFWPLQQEELASSIGRRINSYYTIINKAAHRAEQADLCVVNGFAAGKWYLGRNLTIRTLNAHLRFDAKRWGNQGATPTWLRLIGGTPGHRKALEKVLFSLADASEYWVACGKNNRSLDIPVWLPSGVEENDVLNAVVNRIGRVHELIEHATWEKYKANQQ